MIDDRLSLPTVAKELGGQETLIKKRHFPIPVKISSEDTLLFKKNITETFETVAILLNGSAEFIVKCARTESMKKKEIVKNVMNCA